MNKINFSILEGNYLVKYGSVASEEDLPILKENQTIVIGELHVPTSFDNKSGERWNVITNKWEDCRSLQEKEAAALFETHCNRYKEYPTLNELADAMYWNHKGDPSKLTDYFNRCESVKNKYPKPV